MKMVTQTSVTVTQQGLSGFRHPCCSSRPEIHNSTSSPWNSTYRYTYSEKLAIIAMQLQNIIRPPDGSREDLKKVIPMNFLSFFYQSTVLSSHTVDGHQMYFGGLVIGKISTVGREISSTPPIIFTGGQKMQNLALLHHSTLSCPRLKMQQDIRILKHKCNVVMIALCPGQVW